MATFSGWPAEALAFYEGLAADNSRSYWTEHKTVYEQAVKGPMLALAEQVDAEFGPLHIFRPHRDVRFSKDKRPYKTAMGAVTEGEKGEMYYVQFSAEGLLAAAGYYAMAPDQLARFREAVDDDDLGADVAARCADLVGAGYTLGAVGELKTAPKGYRRDHPRVELLRRKGLMASRSFAPARWLGTKAALTRVVDVWRGTAPLNEWLNAHVGPSTLEPEEAWR
jgi:uncharacterized protein (TIGR02453 family)